MVANKALNQFFTPAWAAEMLVKHYYPNLGEKDMVFDIGSGDGRFLMALPDEVPAYGFEIDPVMAAKAEENSGREVIVGDFTQVDFPAKPTLFLGNPPFSFDLVSKILERAYESLDFNQGAGFLLPVYMFQTADTVLGLGDKWTLKHDLIPRNLFQNMQKPMMFAQFLKERKTTLFGMMLYQEVSDMLSLKAQYRLKFIGNESSTHLWGEVVEQALLSLGGRATLQEVYGEIEGKRPTKTKYWKEQIRKVIQENYQRIDRATYALEEKTRLVAGQMALGL